MILFIGLALFLCAAMALAWAWVRRVENGGWTDIFWTAATGIAAVLGALWPQGGGIGIRQVVVALLVGFWAARLGFHLAGRVAGSPEDRRYAKLRDDWGTAYPRRLFQFLQIQAACGWLLALLVWVAAHNPAHFPGPLDGIGLLLAAIALAGEALADYQLEQFRADPANHGQICQTGLRAWTRHPNYFCDWVFWLALPLLAIDPYGGYLLGWVSLAAPLLMYLVLVHGSGIPILDEHMARTRGAAWIAYRNRTAPFIPFLHFPAGK